MDDRPRSFPTPRTRAAAVLLLALTTILPGNGSGHLQDDPGCRAWMRLELPRLQPMENGSAWDPENGVLWPREAYWEVEGGPPRVDEAPDAYLVCPCIAGRGSRPCLRKCCPKDRAMDRSSLECVPHPVKGPWFKPPVAQAVDPGVADGPRKTAEDLEKHFFVFHSSEDKCEKSGRILLEQEFFISAEDGSLITQNGTRRDDPGSFCVDYFVGEDTYIPMRCFEETTAATIDGETMEESTAVSGIAAVNTTGDDVVAAANDSSRGTCDRIIYILYPIGMLISIVFLTLSLLVHAYVRELRNLHGKCLMCHISSLLTAYVFLTLVQVFGNYLDDNFCISAAFIVYFSFLSTFLWLNIMCIDMFIAFSGMRMMAGSAQERERKKFMMYAAYSWGIPLVILAISLYTEFGPVPDYILKPEFRETCWFNSDSSRIAYFIAPVGVIIACNIVLFVLTALKIYRLRRETRVLKKGDSRRHQQDGDDNNQRFKLYLKLFIVMGVNWALEIISWIVGGDCIWIPFDLLNTMQGLFVFFIFVWKVKIRRKLAKSLCPRLAAKLKFMVPTTTLSSDRRPSASTASSNMVNSCADDNKFKLDTVSARIAETVPSAEVTTVT